MGARWLVGTLLFLGAFGVQAAEQPNILWLSAEDIGPHLGCYGDPYAHTPNLDRMAAEGIRFTKAFTVAPVCAPNRTAIITGMYPTSLGMQHMRAGGEGMERSVKPRLPSHVRPFPEYLREAGYYCTNNAKEDYNFEQTRAIWDESSRTAHWRDRSDPEQPFFAVFNFQGTHEGSVRQSPEAHARATERLTPEQRQDPNAIVPPPYHPNTPIVRENWATYHENITALDYWVADHLRTLKEAGLADNTIVFFWSDHGAGLPRNKRWLYDSGTHIPLIVKMPGPGGIVLDNLVSSIDLPPTVLNLAGLPIPEYMQGQPFLGNNLPAPRRFVYGARDRMDERYDIIRMVRDGRFKYIHNYQPFKPYNQFTNTAEKSPVMQELRRLAKSRTLSMSARWVVRERKPTEELYDTQADPHELHNLVNDYEYAGLLGMMRSVHMSWAKETGDLGLIPEAELAALGLRYGSRQAILGRLNAEDPDFEDSLVTVATLAGWPETKGLISLELERFTRSKHASIRYWAAVGLGNRPGNDTLLIEMLDDSAAIVRIAAAQGLLASGEVSTERSLEILIDSLASEQEWERLAAADALDAIGEAARRAIPALQEALNDTENKYVVRVANHALNELLGTNNPVR